MQLEKLKSPGLIFLSFILFLLVTCANAQHGYIPGFVIKQSGDTVHGFIKQQNSKKATVNCWFKNNSSSESQSFTPSDLQGYRFSNSKYYITKEYKTDKEVNLVFMEYLIKGKANIYYFRNTSGDHYMIEREGEEMIELTEPQKYIQKEGYGTVKVEPKYRGKLLFELKDCSSVQSLIMESKLSNPSLTQLAKEYHDCVCTTESCIIYEKEKTKPVIVYSILGGYSLIRYNFGDNLSTNWGSGMQVGLNADFKRFLFSDEKLGFTLGVLLERDFSFTLSKHDKNDPNGEQITYEGEQYTIDNEEGLLTTKSLNIALNVTAIKVPIMFNYTYAPNRFSVQVGLGISNRFILKRNEEFIYESFDRQYGKTIRTYFIGPTASLVANYRLSNQKNLTAQIAGDYLTDPSALNQYLRLNISQFTFRVGYSL